MTMFLHQLVRRHRRRRRLQAESCSRDNFWTTFQIYIWQDWWTWAIDYLIRLWTICVMTLIFNYHCQIWNPLYLGQKWSDTSIEILTSNVTIGYHLGRDLDLEFSRANMEFAISRPKMVPLQQNKKQTNWLSPRPQMWPSDLTLAMTLTEFLRWSLEFAIS